MGGRARSMGGDPEGIDTHRSLASIVAARMAAGPAKPFLIGIGGAVAVGKSTLADALCRLLPGPVEVVPTDAFLLPNRELEARGLVARKGFPESYDVGALEAVLRALRQVGVSVTIPVYSHATYDIVAGARHRIDRPAVVIVEGVNALRFSGLLDCGLYLDAEDALVEQWYTERFVDLCARPEPGSFYEAWSTLDAAEAAALAGEVWRAVNLVNLREHILPTRARADVIVDQGPGHRVLSVHEVR